MTNSAWSSVDKVLQRDKITCVRYEWGCSSAGEHFPRTEGVGRSNRLSSTILTANHRASRRRSDFYAVMRRGSCRWRICEECTRGEFASFGRLSNS